jgi:hypothetical protein
MKKTIFIVSVIIFCLQIAGLSQKSKVGFTGGISIANMRGTVDGKDQKQDARTGLTFGLIVDAPLKEHISFQPGLHYVQKGKQQDQNNIKTVTALRYAELQLNFLYSGESYTNALFIGAGPAFSVNFPSKIVTKIENTKTETDITFGNETEDLRGFDFGANFLCGLRFPHGFLVSFNYTLGLRNLVPGGSDTDKIKNSAFGARIGLLIDNK